MSLYIYVQVFPAYLLFTVLCICRLFFSHVAPPVHHKNSKCLYETFAAAESAAGEEGAEMKSMLARLLKNISQPPVPESLQLSLYPWMEKPHQLTLKRPENILIYI